MARWRLRTPHYLNVPHTEWEYEEQDRQTGKRLRHRFPVPALLDPASPGDQTPPGSGDIYVCWEGKGQRHDIVFVGDPTPDMEPMDDEAEAISATLAPKWAHPIDTLPGTGDYSQSLLATFQKQLDAVVQAATQKLSPVPNTGGVDPAEFAELKAQVALLSKRNAELEARRV